MRISIVQTDICWENKKENLRKLREVLHTLRGVTDVAVLPEMFSTGFTMNTRQLAEPLTGETITCLKAYAAEFGIALAGSYIAKENAYTAQDCDNITQHSEQFFNRAFFLTPEGDAHYYDKRHLFRMGRENEYFAAGDEKGIFSYKGFNIRLLVCYDLRFPVWSRNVENEYDVLIYVASWPDVRRKVWDTLLPARALENECYVCGVNRVGTDDAGLNYDGGSVIYSPKAEVLASVPGSQEGTATIELDLSALQQFRKKFPAWADADKFHIEQTETNVKNHT